MQVKAITNNNSNQTFGATLKIHRHKRNLLGRSEINWLEKEFPKRTKDIKGHLYLFAGFRTPYESVTDKLKYSNGKHNRYKTYIETYVNYKKPKEELLDILVNSLEGFINKENTHNKIAKLQKKIDRLQKEIEVISDKAWEERAEIFQNLFHEQVWNR